MDGMTIEMQPSAKLRRQDVVAMNANMILGNTDLMKKDLAKAMGISPQSMASRLQGKANWNLAEPQRSKVQIHAARLSDFMLAA